jgi:hypothetical protein
MLIEVLYFSPHKEPQELEDQPTIIAFMSLMNFMSQGKKHLSTHIP